MDGVTTRVRVDGQGMVSVRGATRDMPAELFGLERARCNRGLRGFSMYIGAVHINDTRRVAVP